MRTSRTWASRLVESGHERRSAVQKALYDRVPAERILRDLQLNPGGVRRDLDAVVESILGNRDELMSLAEKRELTDAVIAEVTGYGPLTPFLDDPRCSEVMVNGLQVRIERDGELQLTGARFADEQHVLHVVRRILDPTGRRIDQSSPMVNARLPDGARLNAVMAPLALRGPYVTIRKFREQPFTMSELVERQSLTAEAARFLIACVRGRRNIVVSGNTGSGKTTLLNVLCRHIAPYERVVTIEDPAELRIDLPDINSLEPKPANQEGKGGASMRDLVANALRMRPDRIIVGEVRDGAALDMLQAMNTGHDGSLTTVHANSATHVVSRLETLALHADVDLPARAIRKQIADAIHLIVHQQRIVGHPVKRKVVSIAAVTGMADENVELQEIFRLRQDTPTDEPVLVYTGARPPWLRDLELAGIGLPF